MLRLSLFEPSSFDSRQYKAVTFLSFSMCTSIMEKRPHQSHCSGCCVMMQALSAVKRPISQRRDTIRQFYEFLLPQAAEKAYSSAHCRYNGVPRSGAQTSDFSAHVCVWWASSQIFFVQGQTSSFMWCKYGKEWMDSIRFSLFVLLRWLGESFL